MLFKDRTDAGQKLSSALKKYKGAQQTIVLGLPRGGVVVAYEVAVQLHLPLDILIPRKLGAPHNPELAIGAIAEEGIFLDKEVIADLGVSETYIAEQIAKEKKEAKRRLSLFRKNRPFPNLVGWTALVVDDGLATGSTMQASIQALKKMRSGKIVVAVPIGPPDTIEALKKEVAEVVCLYTPSSFMAVGQFYDIFPQTSDTEVIQLLEHAWK